MPDELTRDGLMARWRAFFDLYGAEEVRRVIDLYPDQRSVYLDFGVVEGHDPGLADQVLLRPQTALYCAELAVKERVAVDANRPRGECHLHVRVKGLPGAKMRGRLDVRDMRAKHGGRMVAIEGMVRRRDVNRPLVEEAYYLCERCHGVVSVVQSDFGLEEPVECFKDQGGCGRTGASTKFKFLAERSERVDAQRLVLQELPERVKEGEQPERLICWVYDDLVNTVKPGQRVTLNGIVKEMAAERRRAGRGLLLVHLEVVSIESDEKTGDLELTPEDVAAIEAEAGRTDTLERIARSVAPTLYGLEVEKLAVALQLFGGSTKTMPDNSRLRGEIHLLLLGDPSTGKSQLLAAVKALHYRAVGATGRGASGAGLTAAVVKDELTGEFGLEPGVLPMADGGIACIDEADKMDEDDRDRMHPAMEQGIVEINKASIQATMSARTSVLAAANPKFSAWRADRALIDQVDLPMSLVSRFDAMFVLKDVPDGGARDGRLAEHILRAHYVGSLADQEASPDAENRAGAAFAPPLSAEFIRKYIFYARTRHRAPVMTPETMVKLKQLFLDLRKETAGTEEHVARITPRQLEGMVRFAEASARARLSRTVEVRDAEVAIRVFESWVTRLADTGGKWNLDILHGGLFGNIKDSMNQLKDTIRACEVKGKGAPKEAILERAEKDLGMKRDQTLYLIEKLYQEGGIYEREDDHYRVA